MRFTTKAIKQGKGSYLVEVIDTLQIQPTSNVLIEYSSCSDSGTGWRTFQNVDGDWECHDAPLKTKREALYFLKVYGL